MGTRLRNMNDKAYSICKERFEFLLELGAWPAVQYKSGGGGCASFLMFEYSDHWSRFAKAVHDRLVLAGYEYGLWQNARNSCYLGEVGRIANNLTVEEVDVNDRFKTMWD